LLFSFFNVRYLCFALACNICCIMNKPASGVFFLSSLRYLVVRLIYFFLQYCANIMLVSNANTIILIE
jgi:hypothetical protein